MPRGYVGCPGWGQGRRSITHSGRGSFPGSPARTEASHTGPRGGPMQLIPGGTHTTDSDDVGARDPCDRFSSGDPHDGLTCCDQAGTRTRRWRGTLHNENARAGSCPAPPSRHAREGSPCDEMTRRRFAQGGSPAADYDRRGWGRARLRLLEGRRTFGSLHLRFPLAS